MHRYFLVSHIIYYLCAEKNTQGDLLLIPLPMSYATPPLHIVFFAERDLEKLRFTMKYLAAQLVVKPLFVHVFLRNGRSIEGRVLARKTVAKLCEMKQFLEQTLHTFRTIGVVGSLSYELVAQDKPSDTCVADYRALLDASGQEFRLMRLPNDRFDEPWKDL